MLLKHRAINGWALFGLVSTPLSVLVILEMLETDLSGGPGVSAMIGFSVRLAVPFIFLAMAASSVHVLFPGSFSKWWLRNRKYIGLCFAVGMAWQALFIFMMSTVFRDYYFENVYYFRDELEGSVGYLFLAGMVVTSFGLARKRLEHTQWKIIQKGGLYFLWAYAFSVYWWNLFYYENPEPIDYIYYCMGFLAFALRIAAWGKNRHKRAARSELAGEAITGVRVLGSLMIAVGLLIAATGLHWQAAVTEFLTTPGWSATLELWLPFWPLEPFFSLIVIGLGTRLLTTTR